MEEFDFFIAGAGPIGSYLAQKLADKGFKVGICDSKKVIGKPVQCTGLLTRELEKYVKISDKFTDNITSKVVLKSKNNSFSFKSKEYVIDRFKFDNYLLNEAKNSGAKAFLGNGFLGEKNNKIILDNLSIKAKTLVGSDGPLSQVNKHFGIIKKMDYFLGKQYVIKGKTNDNSYKVYFDEKFNDFFAWQVPVSKNISRFGIASQDMKSVNSKMDYFMKSMKIKGNILETNAGLIPLYNPPNKNYMKTKNGMNVYLFGDASGMLKATTGGGIIPGFRAVNDSINELIQGKEPKLNGLKSELKMHLLAHNIMKKLKDSDYDSIISDANDKKISYVLENVNRDNAVKLISKALISKPFLIKYIRFVI